MYARTLSRNCSHDSNGKKSGAESVTTDIVVKVSSNLCPQPALPTDGLDLRDFATGSLVQLQDYGMPPSALHCGQGANIIGEDSALTSVSKKR